MGMDLGWDPSQVWWWWGPEWNAHAYNLLSLPDFEGQGQSVMGSIREVLRNPRFLLAIKRGLTVGLLSLVHPSLPHSPCTSEWPWTR